MLFFRSVGGLQSCHFPQTSGLTLGINNQAVGKFSPNCLQAPIMLVLAHLPILPTQFNTKKLYIHRDNHSVLQLDNLKPQEHITGKKHLCYCH